MSFALVLSFQTSAIAVRLIAGRCSDMEAIPEPPDGGLRGSAEGCKAVVNLALCSKLGLIQKSPTVVSLDGDEDSPAYALYRSYDDIKRLSWPAVIFGTNDRFQNCLSRSSHQGPNGKKVYSIRFDSGLIPPSRIRVYLDGNDISNNRDALTQLIGTLFKDVARGGRSLRLGILRSGDLAYTRDIEKGLREQLEALGYDLSPTPNSIDGPQASPATEEGRPGWEIAVRKRFERGGSEGFDFIVGIGTQAMLAFKQYYGDRLGVAPEPKVIFLGVTYPVTSHLIDSLYSRYEPREVCGVAYAADGLRSIAGLIRNWLAPQSRLKFVYFSEHAQDADAADQLRRTRLFAEKTLDIQESSPSTLHEALQHADDVYFSWYTFESIFESTNPTLDALAGSLKKRKVVATTRHNCEHRYAFAAVAADDIEIGQQGAHIIHGSRLGKILHLGRHNVVVPRVRYWLNRSVIKDQGIELPEEVFAGAEKVYD